MLPELCLVNGHIRFWCEACQKHYIRDTWSFQKHLKSKLHVRNLAVVAVTPSDGPAVLPVIARQDNLLNPITASD